MTDPVAGWLGALEKRHLAELTFQEVRRALQALSSLYVERRGRLGSGAALEGAGKRAAFALYYGPLHFLLVREIVRSLGAATPAPQRLLDLGCGSGVAGAAWAVEAGGRPSLEGVDRSAWAVQEARWTYARLGLRGRALRGDAASWAMPRPPAGAIAAFTLNELTDEARQGLRGRLLEAGKAGVRVLVVEPIARRSLPWWAEWSRAFVAAGGRDDEWRFPAALPERLRLLDKASGLDHRVLTGRSLWLNGSRRPKTAGASAPPDRQ